jgi:transposase
VIGLPASVRVYLCTVPCDMRRSFDGLHGLVTSVMELDALAGHLFVFSSRKKDRVKIFYWDRDGFAIWSKRLEEGTYAMPFGQREERRAEITAQELSALLSGIDLSQAKRRKRYEHRGVAVLKNISINNDFALKSAGLHLQSS